MVEWHTAGDVGNDEFADAFVGEAVSDASLFRVINHLLVLRCASFTF